MYFTDSQQGSLRVVCRLVMNPQTGKLESTGRGWRWQVKRGQTSSGLGTLRAKKMGGRRGSTFTNLVENLETQTEGKSRDKLSGEVEGKCKSCGNILSLVHALLFLMACYSFIVARVEGFAKFLRLVFCNFMYSLFSCCRH